MTAGVALYVGNESFYENVAMPLCRLLPAETMHHLAIQAAKYNIVPKDQSKAEPILVSMNNNV